MDMTYPSNNHYYYNGTNYGYNLLIIIRNRWFTLTRVITWSFTIKIVPIWLHILVKNCRIHNLPTRRTHWAKNSLQQVIVARATRKNKPKKQQKWHFEHNEWPQLKCHSRVKSKKNWPMTLYKAIFVLKNGKGDRLFTK